MRIKRRLIWGFCLFCLLFLLTGISHQAQSQKFKEQFVDTLDNALDVSQWLANVYGFVPIVTLITEPAIGFGAGGGLIFIHRKKEDLIKAVKSPPSLSMVGGLYTENGTWGTALAHRGIWRQDRIRYLGAIGYVSANLTLYRTLPIIGERSFRFNIKGAFLIQEAVFRIKKTNFFLGGRYSFFGSTISFKTDLPIPVDSLELDLNLGALSPVIRYDSRDNTFTPNRGMQYEFKFSFYDNIFGSDREYWRFDSYWTGFFHPNSWLVLGFRGDLRFASDETPFYAEPFINLRGIPALRYQDDNVIVLETEERFDITRRWSAVGFVGAGNAFPDFDDFSSGSWGYSVGAGFRYKLARLFNLYLGADVARGNEQWAFYIQFGHYWNGL